MRKTRDTAAHDTAATRAARAARNEAKAQSAAACAAWGRVSLATAKKRLARCAVLWLLDHGGAMHDTLATMLWELADGRLVALGLRDGDAGRAAIVAWLEHAAGMRMDGGPL